MRNLDIRAHYNVPMRGIEFYIFADDDDGNPLTAKKIEFREREPGISIEPAFEILDAIPTNAAQVLMDDLWNCGIRPTEGKGSAGALSATKEHLKDMQKISWRLLDNLTNEE